MQNVSYMMHFALHLHHNEYSEVTNIKNGFIQMENGKFAN